MRKAIADLIGRHTQIDEYAKISDFCIDNFCILKDHVTVKRSAVMDGCTIGEYSRIIDSIIGRKVNIESSNEHPTHIEDNSVVGNSCKIRAGCRLVRTRVNPNLIIPSGCHTSTRFSKRMKMWLSYRRSIPEM